MGRYSFRSNRKRKVFWNFPPGKPLTLEFVHADGSKDTILANHTYNEAQIGWFKAGSALNLIKQQAAS